MHVPGRKDAQGTGFEGIWDTPGNWPRDVHRVSLDLMDHLGVHHRTNELYWDGQKLITEKRFSNFERGLAVAGLVIAGIGVAATVVQAWAAVAALPG